MLESRTSNRADRTLSALGRHRNPRTRHAGLLILCARIGYTPPV